MRCLQRDFYHPTIGGCHLLQKKVKKLFVTWYNFVFFRRCLKPGPLVKEEPVADVEEENRPSSPAESLRSFKDLPLPPRPSLSTPPTSPAPSHPAFPPPPAGCHHHRHRHHHHHRHYHNQVVFTIVITTTIPVPNVIINSRLFFHFLLHYYRNAITIIYSNTFPKPFLVATPSIAGYLFTPQKQKDISSSNFENNKMSALKAASAGKRKKKGQKDPIPKRKKSTENETIKEFAIREKGGQK